ncbi:MAG: NUDIX domain-containing protein [Pseudomonadota bacterium]
MTDPAVTDSAINDPKLHDPKLHDHTLHDPAVTDPKVPDPDLTTIFVFGTLRDPELRRIVFGLDVRAETATLPNFEVRTVPGGNWPVLCPAADAEVEGLLFAVPEAALARADYYEGLFDYVRQRMTVKRGTATRTAEVWAPAHMPETAAEPWSLAAWQQHHAELAHVAASEVMALYGERPAVETARRAPMIWSRAQARLNGRQGGPTTLRRATGPADIEIVKQRTPYAHFFAVEEYDLRHATFSGGMSAEIKRAVFISSDAVTVLPYDPVRDRVLLIEQFRPGPLARGDRQVWSLEAVAGRIDPGETPEAAARREAREEARLEIGELIALASYYPSPGAKSEYLYCYLAMADLPDGAAGLGGLADEHEDIRAHVIPFARLLELYASGELDNGPLLLSVLELKERRDGLRASLHADPEDDPTARLGTSG